MTLQSSFHSLRIAVTAALLGAASSSAAVVFDNTLNVQPGFGAQTTREYGDELALAGTDRYVTEFVLQYQAEFTGSAGAPAPTATIRIYANDGPSALPGQTTAPRPGTLLWESSALNLANGDNILSLAPNILVPDTITWSVEFSGLSGAEGDRAALTISSPPTVGGELKGGVIGSYNDYWIKTDPNDSDSWALRRIEDGQVPANFYARVVAVPEPATVALAIVGLGGLTWMHRRRNR
ncbi:MAG: PEP-CTERM sorting domain-containing protein [Verrucomicrobiae bacterium]|nr:PEP-CTERM sorting domain-containing protein [Verrucomicrobiae bacterium]